jgi:acyl-CoA reductase-like NAD-dependent aldehyde dehydrogenase
MVTIKGTESRYHIGPIERSSRGNGHQPEKKKGTQERTDDFNLAEIQMARVRQEEAANQLQKAILEHEKTRQQIADLSTPEQDKIQLRRKRDDLAEKIRELRNQLKN